MNGFGTLQQALPLFLLLLVVELAVVFGLLGKLFALHKTVALTADDVAGCGIERLLQVRQIDVCTIVSARAAMDIIAVAVVCSYFSMR